MSEYYVGLDSVQKILSDPIWREKAREVGCKDELRLLLLEFCSEKGEIIKINEKTIVLYVDHQI